VSGLSRGDDYWDLVLGTIFVQARGESMSLMKVNGGEGKVNGVSGNHARTPLISG
jgi:hypothetical protein